VRTPTRVERDIFAQANDANDDLSLRVLGNRNLRAEEMIAYELGYRVWATPNVLVDVAAFYNDYDRLVTFEIGDPFAEGERTIIPVRNGNKMHGDAYGGEIAVDWQPAKFWRVAASYSALQLDLRADRDSTDRSSQNSDVSPKNQAQLRSMLDLRRDLELDAWLRWVDNLPFDATSSYWNLDLRLAWHASPSLELALVGQNLLRNHHGEISFGTEVERGGYAKVTWRFGV
jgi:iron complex outermembrane receptor protein